MNLLWKFSFQKLLNKGPGARLNRFIVPIRITIIVSTIIEAFLV